MKVLALAPGRRLHREQVIDLVWPGDTIAAAVPKLHEAEPSCTGPGRIREWPKPSSTATCARPSTCCTGLPRTPRSWSWPATCAGPRNGARALRAAAFARALSGEAALLSGDLDLAAAELTEASAGHRDLGSAAGEAHSLQRLAEVRLAQGDDAEARRLLERALPLARSSIVAKHLLHRVFGTMIRAAASRPEAVQIAERAESTLGWDDFCQFCSIMLAVPATIACARHGDLPGARTNRAFPGPSPDHRDRGRILKESLRRRADVNRRAYNRVVRIYHE